MTAPAAPVRYHIRHRTLYAYRGEVAHSHQLLYLMPRACEHQHCFSHSLRIAPLPASRRDSSDAFGNPVTRLEFDRPHNRLDVEATMDVEIRSRAGIEPPQSLPWEQVQKLLQYSASSLSGEVMEAVRFRCESAHVRIKRALGEYALACFTPGRPLLAAAEALTHKIHSEFTYAPGETTIATPLMQVHERRRGVCQDYAHFMISCLRSLGLAARYVSGYLRTEPRGGARGLVGADASHAWVAVYAPPFGWVELDPTNDVRVDRDHIALAWGRDYGDVSPLRGVILGGGQHKLSVTVQVRPLRSGATDW